MICPQTWLKATTHPNSVTQLKISLLTAWTTPIQETCSQPPSPDPRRNKESYTSLNGNTQTEDNVPIPRFWYFFQYFHQLLKIYLNGPIINKNLGVRYWSKNLIDQERRKEQLTLSFHTSHLERAPWILLSPPYFFLCLSLVSYPGHSKSLWLNSSQIVIDSSPDSRLNLLIFSVSQYEQISCKKREYTNSAVTETWNTSLLGSKDTPHLKHTQ